MGWKGAASAAPANWQLGGGWKGRRGYPQILWSVGPTQPALDLKAADGTSVAVNGVTFDVEAGTVGNLTSWGWDGSTGLGIVGTGAAAARLECNVANMASDLGVSIGEGDVLIIDQSWTVNTAGALCQVSGNFRDTGTGAYIGGAYDEVLTRVGVEGGGGVAWTASTGQQRRMQVRSWSTLAGGVWSSATAGRAIPGDLTHRGNAPANANNVDMDSAWTEAWFRLDVQNTTDILVTDMALLLVEGSSLYAAGW